MRATSSIRSTSRVTSPRRKCGTATPSASVRCSTPKASDSRISSQRRGAISLPSSALARAGRSASSGGGSPGPPTSIVPGSTRAPHSSIISAVATAWASSVESTERPFSKRPDASLRKPRRAPLRWTFAPSQLATSSSTRVVFSFTSERAPPMIAAIEVGPSASLITTISWSSVRTAPSSVSMVSPSWARRTVSRPPATRSRSKACSGWPLSTIA